MKTNDIRQTFLEYFYKNKLNHAIKASSSLIPFDDSSLFFVNAGMVPFKNYFLNIEKPPAERLTSVQRCMRVSGKHNDLNQVGHTTRHHTFFEMLGNFSFGDYFKREAIFLAWDLLTQVFKIPPEKLWVTVYKDDHESANIWLKEMKIDPDRFSYCGEKDNFWSMGETGPCGPCSEIFYDHGEKIAGGPPGSKEQEGDRFVEIWNLVFMQHNRDASGKLTPLPKPCVDTGMGLERLAAVLQGVHDNYDIDLFQHLLKALSSIVQCDDFKNPAMRVIVDHIRATAFLIADGILPSNEGRGYVLRRIMRRAIRYGAKLGCQKPFFHQLVKPLIDLMGAAYPELKTSQSLIEKTILQEEKQFDLTLKKGMKIFEQFVENNGNKTITGQVAFQLYDTFGFPLDLTCDIAKERGLTVDYAGFEAAMQKQRQQSQQTKRFAAKKKIDIAHPTQFSGYDTLKQETSVIALFVKENEVNSLKKNEAGVVILNQTPFYAESGGQASDTGLLMFKGGSFQVTNVQKQGQTYLHFGEIVSGQLTKGTSVQAEVDSKRHAIAANHTATHLLQGALQQILGSHVLQKGSLVTADRIRFDFAHSAALTQAERHAIEQLINLKIRENLPVNTDSCDLEAAKKRHAMALFGEKYGQKVRVVEIPNFSIELCGGTHAKQTGEIGLFKIMAETAIAAGIRRIEAITGEAALLDTQAKTAQLDEMAKLLNTDTAQLPQKFQQAITDARELEKELESVKQKIIQQQIAELKNSVVRVGEINVLATLLDHADPKTLRFAMDQLKAKITPCVIVLAAIKNKNIQLLSGVSKDLTPKLSAVDLIKYIAAPLGGKGGGRLDLAQGGGVKINLLSSVLLSVQDWVAKNSTE